MTSAIPDAWFRRAVEVVPYGVACVGMENEFVYVNHAYCKIVGYSQVELIGRTWMSITADDDVGGDLRSVDDLKTDNGSRDSYTLEKKYKHRDGHHVSILLSVFTFTENGTIKLFIACASANMTTAEVVAKYERDFKQEVSHLRSQIEAIQAEREFRLKVFSVLKEHWKLISGIIVIGATAIWNLARVK